MKNSLWYYHDRVPGHELLTVSHQHASGGGSSTGGHIGNGSTGSGGGMDDDAGVPSVSPRVMLEDRDLWEKFHGLTNEMIVTKSGR